MNINMLELSTSNKSQCLNVYVWNLCSPMHSSDLSAPGENQVAVLLPKCFQLGYKKKNVSFRAVCLDKTVIFLVQTADEE